MLKNTFNVDLLVDFRFAGIALEIWPYIFCASESWSSHCDSYFNFSVSVTICDLKS